jgi:hypothetical protein
MTVALPFSETVRLNEIGTGLQRTLEPDAAIRTRIARSLDLASLDAFTADLSLGPNPDHGAGGWRLSGRHFDRRHGRRSRSVRRRAGGRQGRPGAARRALPAAWRRSQAERRTGQGPRGEGGLRGTPHRQGHRHGRKARPGHAPGQGLQPVERRRVAEGRRGPSLRLGRQHRRPDGDLQADPAHGRGSGAPGHRGQLADDEGRHRRPGRRRQCRERRGSWSSSRSWARPSTTRCTGPSARP